MNSRKKWLKVLLLASFLGIFGCVLFFLQSSNVHGSFIDNTLVDSQELDNIWQETSSGLSFDHIVIDLQGPDNIWLKTVGDINDDGLTDMIAGGVSSGGLVWYQYPEWSKHQIDSGGGFSTDGEVIDVEMDGDNDLIVLTNGDLRWYANPSWDVTIIDNRTLHDVEVSDFDGDGDVDLVARNQGEFGNSGNELHFYRQDSPSSWTHRSIACSDGEGLKLVDVDRDGDQDVVTNGSWFENTNDILNGPWAAFSFTSSWTHPNTFVGSGDIDGDGLVDLIMAPAELAGDTYRISWFEAPANPKNPNWTEHIVEDNVESVHHFVGVADFDNDGDQDIAAAEMHQGNDPDEVKVYLNEDGVGESWTKQILATTGSHSMRILDVDNDGDQDLYGANWQGNQVELWENQVCTPTLGNWERHVIDPEKPWRTIFIEAADMDHDGLQDIVTGGWWYKNPGSPNGSWARRTIGEPLNNIAALYDFDRDGLVDVLGTAGQGSDPDPRFVWAHNDGSGSFTVLNNIKPGAGDFLQGVAVGTLADGGGVKVALSWHSPGDGIQMLSVPADPLVDTWTIEEISTLSQDEALSLGDIEQDGDKDLLLGTIWLENKGSSWNDHILHDASGYPYGERDPDRNRLADINGDGRLDAVVGYEAISSQGKLAWYEQGQIATETWQEHTIAQVVGPMSLDVVDIDLDGDLDVIIGEHNLEQPTNAKLSVFENFDGVGNQWKEHIVHIGDEHHDGAQTVDIDNDGDLDIISIGWGHTSVLLYENITMRCDNSAPSTSTPETTPSPTVMSTDSPSPTSMPTEITGTPIPEPPNNPISCIPGILFPAGLTLVFAHIWNLFRATRALY